MSIGRRLALEARGCRFESCHPDHESPMTKSNVIDFSDKKRSLKQIQSGDSGGGEVQVISCPSCGDMLYYLCTTGDDGHILALCQHCGEVIGMLYAPPTEDGE